MGAKKEKTKRETNSKKLPKNISQKMIKRVFKNLVIVILIILYFIILNYARTKMKEERLIGDMQVFAGTFLVLGIVFLEQAYRRDDGYHALNGIEMIVLSGHTLSAMHIISRFQYDFQNYMLTSSYIISIYYVLKTIIIYTIGKKQYINRFNDISEIVKDEPQKKEAKKRKITKGKKEENKEKKLEEDNKQTKKDTKTKAKRMTGTKIKKGKRKK